MWDLDCEEGWVPKNWCFWTVVLEKTLESPLNCKEIQPVHSEDQPWDFFGRNDAKAETSVLWPPIPPSIRVFSNESTVRMRWPKYWSFSFSIIPSKEILRLIFRMDWLDLLAVQGTLKSLLQHHTSKTINSLGLTFLYSPILTSIHDYWKNHSLD